MASGGSDLPAFQEIIKRGSASEPRKTRPIPKLNKESHNGELSLNAAVHAAKIAESYALNNMAAAASEPKRSKRESNKEFSYADGTPSRSRRRTCMTLPRTKVSANTPLEQKVALKKLKQRLNFEKEDQKQALTYNHENVKKKRTAKTNGSLPIDMVSLSSVATSDIPDSELSEFNSTKLSERLEQVRNYLKEATTMYVSLSINGAKEPKQTDQMNKLAKLIQQLRIQENGYLELLQKTLAMDDANSIADSTSIAETASVAETVSVASGDDGYSEVLNPELYAQPTEVVNPTEDQVQELERLKEQQTLLKKIVDQQKELQVLKDRQAALLQMQQDAETLIHDQRKQNSVPNNQRQAQPEAVRQPNIQRKEQNKTIAIDRTAVNEEEPEQAAYTQKRVELEQKLNVLQEKKQQMDKLAEMLKAFSNAKNENGLNQDDLSEVLSEVLATPIEDANVPPEDDMDVQEKIKKLNDVRDRLNELKGMVADYEQASSVPSPLSKTEASRDNRLHAQAIQQKHGNTVTGQGGARLRIPNGDYLLNDLQALQNGLEELMDNRKRPVPATKQKQKIDVTRNPSAAPRTKNTNQEKRPVNRNTFNENRDIPAEYIEKMRELQLARSRISNEQNSETNSLKSATTQTEDETTSGKESDIDESDASSALQWQDDPEFQNKVKKLNMAKKKLHRLQELVRVVQQSDGPQLPIDDLVDLTLSQSEDFNDTSAYGESEEEAEGEDDEDTCEEEQNDEDDEDDDDDDNDEDQTEDDNVDGQSEVSKSTDMNFNFAPENGLSDNERRYQGLLRKQRLELNYLLKERERLLEAQQKLSTLATTATSTHTQTHSVSLPSAKESTASKTSDAKKERIYPLLTRASLSKQNSRKEVGTKHNFVKRMDGMSVEPHYGSEHDIYPPDLSANDSMTVPLSNPLAVTEIRRQRELFEQNKKQKFVEKQRRKRKNRPDENQSDDRATYSVHSDVDEGVGISMYSADVTTAATWGGSTEQSSSEEDSAVDEDYAPSGQNDEEDGTVNDDFNGSQFDQAEEEEEEGSGANNVPPVFKVKKYANDDEQPRRGISWLNDVTPKKKDSYPAGSGSVTWSLDVSPPRSRKKMRQGNLTPAHKLIQDNKRKRFSLSQYPDKLSKEESSQEADSQIADSQIAEDSQASAHPLQTQLASMCTSLLRNEQTLLSMLQNQYSNGNEVVCNQQPQSSGVIHNKDALNNIQEYFATSNCQISYQETLESLKTCYERVEQHQLDMEYLRQQFSRLNTTRGSVRSPPKPSEYPKPADYQSPWPNPPSLHMSSFGGNTENVEASGDQYFSTSIPSCLKQPDGYQKSTQTETTLFEDPFKPMQQYSLFGEDDKITTPLKTTHTETFNFNPVLEHISPGAIGDRSFFQQHEEFSEANITEQFPYRLRMSEYNPMSYQGLPNTYTGNVMTVSKMSLHKDKAETLISEQSDKNIWPSFFKLAEATVAGDNASDNSSKYTSSLAGQSGANELSKNVETGQKNESELNGEGGSNFSLFEALRDNIYSEVATLIAMNESRPHYLIELFRELQLLNSDYLRQRALYSLQELVTRFLTDENTASSPNKTAAFTKETIPPSEGATRASYEQWIASCSEQTPSESVITTDDESESQVLQTLTRQMQNNEIYDYAELADTQSDGNLSTPGSQSDLPFAADDLGNTVINLDEALDRMKSYETGMANARRAIGLGPVANNTFASPERLNAAYEAVKRHVDLQRESASESSACDVTSEASSDMPQPSVDTQKLDRQIKAVMLDLIPFLNDHIESTCNEELLNEIRSLIVKFARDKEPQAGKEEFGRFFHTQLDSILKDSLMKFQARKLKECGEDILVDVSEILFNELAFFRLMQDLDRPLYNGNPAEGNDVTSTPEVQAASSQVAGVDYDESSAAESTSTLDNEISTAQTSSPASTSSSNAFVMVERVDASDEETESARQFVNVELSVSETRAIRSTGSGEDDNEEEPSQFSMASVPASSINLYSQVVQPNGGGAASSNQQNDQPEAIAVEQEDGEGEADDEPTPEDDRDESHPQQPQEPPQQAEDENENAEAENESAEDERDLDEGVEAEADVIEPDGAEGQAIIMHQHDLEEGTEDDLPEADMVPDDALHQQPHQAAQLVLEHLEGQQELAGDPIALHQPNADQQN